MATIQDELILADGFSDTVGRYIRLLGQASGAAQQASRHTRDFGAGAERAAAQTSSLVERVKSLAGAYLGIQGVKALTALSDTIASTTARLDMMNDGMQTTAELSDMIFASAQRSRGAYAETAAFVAKLGTLAGEAFDSNQEIIDFAEQVNKQIVLSGASATEASAALLQLTQGLSSGVLRGEELNSILEQTPMIAQTIADYMGVTVGQMRELASQGAVTADVVKNAMFAAAEETNAKFESMPMTWGQVWTMFKNSAIQAMQPVLEAISWLANNMETVGPIIMGVVTAVGALTGVILIYNAMQKISNLLAAISAARSAMAAGATLAQAAATQTATGAQVGLNAALLASPLTWVIVIIALIVAAIAKWVQSVGGLEIAWLTAVDAVLTWWDTLKIGFLTGVYNIQNWLDSMALKFQRVSVKIQDWMGDMKVGVLSILQDMVNGAIDIINWMIEQVNKIPGVAIDPIQQATFAANAAAENEAEKAARHAKLTASEQEAAAKEAERAKTLAEMMTASVAAHAARQAEIEQKRAEQAAGGGTGVPDVPPYEEQLSGIGSDVAGIKKSVAMSEEDIKSLVDVAERRYVANVNLTSQTPVINITGQNTGRTAADRQQLADTIRDILIEQAASGSMRSTARAF